MTETVVRRTATRERQAVAWLPEEWRECMQQWGEPAFRAQQIFQWVHRHGVLDVEQMTNLSRSLRAKLREHGQKRGGTHGGATRAHKLATRQVVGGGR